MYRLLIADWSRSEVWSDKRLISCLNHVNRQNALESLFRNRFQSCKKCRRVTMENIYFHEVIMKWNNDDYAWLLNARIRHEKLRGHMDTVRGSFDGLRKYQAWLLDFNSICSGLWKFVWHYYLFDENTHLNTKTTDICRLAYSPQDHEIHSPDILVVTVNLFGYL